MITINNYSINNNHHHHHYINNSIIIINISNKITIKIIIIITIY